MLEELSKTTTSQEDRLTFIKTLGNAGSPDAQEQLQKILKDRQQPLHTRVECVWALRRITRQAKEKVRCLNSLSQNLKTKRIIAYKNELGFHK